MDVLVQIIGIVGPLITQIIQDHFNRTGTWPTPEEIKAAFEKHYDDILSEGADWRSTHPRT